MSNGRLVSLPSGGKVITENLVIIVGTPAASEWTTLPKQITMITMNFKSVEK